MSLFKDSVQLVLSILDEYKFNKLHLLFILLYTIIAYSSMDNFDNEHIIGFVHNICVAVEISIISSVITVPIILVILIEISDVKTVQDRIYKSISCSYLASITLFAFISIYIEGSEFKYTLLFMFFIVFGALYLVYLFKRKKYIPIILTILLLITLVLFYFLIPLLLNIPIVS